MPFQVGGVAVHDDAQHTGSAKRNLASGVAGLNAAGKPIDTSANVVQTTNEKDAASGYAGLNAAGKVPDANLESPVAVHAALTASHGRTNIDGVTERDAAISTHGAATTGIHGVGASTIESASGAQAKVDTHGVATTGIHGVGSSTIASRVDAGSIPIPTVHTLGNGTGMINPNNSKDGDLSTFAGEASYVGDGTAGNGIGLLYDFGMILSRRITTKAGYRASGVNSGYIQIHESDDNITWTTLYEAAANPGATEVIQRIGVNFSGRYLRVRINGATTATIATYLKVYEVF